MKIDFKLFLLILLCALALVALNDSCNKNMMKEFHYFSGQFKCESVMIQKQYFSTIKLSGSTFWFGVKNYNEALLIEIGDKIVKEGVSDFFICQK